MENLRDLRVNECAGVGVRGLERNPFGLWESEMAEQ